jgi:RNA polymerase sigma-70 factor, ECF subfamily
MLSFLPWRTPGAPRPRGSEAVAAALAALQRGEAQALALLYDHEAPQVYRYALALSGNAAWAADATQEAFVALAERPGQVDLARGTLGAWLAGVARHALLAQWRAAQRHDPWPDDDEAADDTGEPAPAQAPSPEAALAAVQDTQAVWAALRQLPPPFREAVLLVDLQERPYAEAAAIAGIELNTLRTRVFRGRQRLAAWLAEPGEASP